MNFHSALLKAKSILKGHPHLEARGLIDSEAEQLVLACFREVTGKKITRSELFLRALDPFPDAVLARLEKLSQERVMGKPLQHLIGYQAFLDHEYEVSSDVLVPRPETEVLVRSAISSLQEQKQSPKLGLEVGLGSGVISIELLAQFSGLTMVASELSQASIEIAKRNLHMILPKQEGRLKVIRVLNPQDVLSPFREDLARLQSKADFLITNPPYLDSPSEVDDEVLQYEPKHALFAPISDPCYFYREIAENAGEYLTPCGWVFAELPHERAEIILKVFQDLGWEAMTQPDLTGRQRILIAHMGAN